MTRTLTTTALILIEFCAALSHAQPMWPDDPWTDTRRLPTTTVIGGTGEVAIDADSAAVIGKSSSQQAFIRAYSRTPSGWQFGPTLTIPLPVATNFALKGDLKGDTIAVATFDRVWIVRRTDDSLAVAQVIEIPLNGPYTVRVPLRVELLDESTLLVGTRNTRIGDRIGVVFRYERDDAGVWTEAGRIENPDKFVELEFGERLATDGQRLLVSAPYGHGEKFTYTGNVFVFDITGDEPALEATLYGRAQYDRFGTHGISVGRDSIAVATSPLIDESAAVVEIYRRIDGFWTPTAIIRPEDFEGVSGHTASFGSSVTIIDDTVFIAWPGAVPVNVPFSYQYGALLSVRLDGNDIRDHRTIFFPNSPILARITTSIDTDGERLFVGGGSATPPNYRLSILSRSPECFRDLRADANNDGVVDFADLSIILSNVGQSGPDLPGDLNRDGEVDMTDLNIVLVLFGSPCLPPN